MNITERFGLRPGPIACCAMFLLLCLPPILLAQTAEERLLRGCSTEVSKKFNRWRFAPVTKDVAEWAKGNGESPTAAYGDFDGDGRKDASLLVQDGPGPASEYPERLDSLHIAVCLNQQAGMKLLVIDKPYCGDGITLRPKGEQYHNFETGAEESYPFDGVHAYCFEKAGATYVFENGAFHQIVDSD